MRGLGDKVRKEDGRVGVSTQYIHDIERDLRAPSLHVLGELAKALDLDAVSLGAVVGHCPEDVSRYLREHPMAGAAVASLFARARAVGYSDWENIDLTATAD